MLIPPTSVTGMMKGFALVFHSNIPEIRFESDKREGDIPGGRKEMDRGGCNIRDREEWCGKRRIAPVTLGLWNDAGEDKTVGFGCH